MVKFSAVTMHVVVGWFRDWEWQVLLQEFMRCFGVVLCAGHGVMCLRD